MSKPIIFTHYGNTPYLKNTLKCARITNPDCKIILLGDKSNRETALKAGIDHFCFDKLIAGPKRQRFNNVFKPVHGRYHKRYKNGGFWLRYVFEQWFYVYEYALSAGFDSFWHFDSDTMIVVSLSEIENLFKIYDCTEQCNGSCMSGYIHLSSLGKYLDVINELFDDEVFLEKQRLEFEQQNQHFAFTEMRAYMEMKKRNEMSTFHLAGILNGTTFDGCICQDEGYETVRLASGEIVKNYYYDSGFYCLNKKLGFAVKFNALNLSWVPDFVFDWVLDMVENKDSTSKKYYISSYNVPISFFFKCKLNIISSIIREKIGWEANVPLLDGLKNNLQDELEKIKGCLK